MKRTRGVFKTSVSYNVEEEPIVLSKRILDLFLKQDNGAELLYLYTFYYYTAKWQKTNQIKATTSFVATGLKWTEVRVRKTKRILNDLGLIENIINRNEDNVITGHFIKVNFIWGHSQADKFSHGAEIHPMGNHHPNALSTDTINALSTDKEKKKNNKKDFFLEYFPKEWQKDQTFQNTLSEYIEHRKEKHSILTPTACFRLANKLSTYTIKVAIEALDTSIENGWTGVFPESVGSYKRKESLQDSIDAEIELRKKYEKENPL